MIKLPQTMMNVPRDKLLKSRNCELGHLPVKNQDPGSRTRLDDFGSDGYVVVEAESHDIAGFSMVSWRSDDRKRSLTGALGDSQRGIDGSPATESSGQGGISIDVEGQQLVVASVTQDLIIRQV